MRATHTDTCRYNSYVRQMEFVPDEEWKTPEMLSWRQPDIDDTLDRAQTLLEEAAASLRLHYKARFITTPKRGCARLLHQIHAACTAVHARAGVVV